MYDIVALGELLVDFTPFVNPDSGNTCFERNAGGAPANVLVAATRLGSKCAFIGKVGRDNFGAFLEKTLQKNDVDTSGLQFSSDVNTTLAFVFLDAHGDRSFGFYRKPGADIMLTADEVDYSLIDNATVFHFGSLSMTDEPARSATLAALDHAKKAGRIISYDPNWRPPLWKSEEAAKAAMLAPMSQVDILKISETELTMLTGQTDLKKGLDQFLRMGVKIVIATLGPKGCLFGCRSGMEHLPTYDTRVVDTTGSGDAFFGAFLSNICRFGIDPESVTLSRLRELVDYSNAAGAICASMRGAIPAMPDRKAIERCMKTVPKLIV